jgi:hypothetical protein
MSIEGPWPGTMEGQMFTGIQLPLRRLPEDSILLVK